MEWTISKQEDFTLFEAEAADDCLEELEASAQSLWDAVERQLLPLHSEHDWDCLRLEFWPDSGRTIVFPSKRPFEERTEHGVLQVIWPSLVTAWEDLERKGLEDAEFESGIRDDLERILDVLERTFEASSFSHRFEVECFNYGEDHIRTFGAV